MKKHVAYWLKTHKLPLIGAAVVVLALLVLLLCFGLGVFSPQKENLPSSAMESSSVSEEIQIPAEAQSGAGNGEAVQLPAEEAGQVSSSEPESSTPSSQSTVAETAESGSQPSGEVSGETGGSPSPATEVSQPVHQHNWQPHEVWVPNLVTVVDTPEQTIQGAQLYTQQPDGSWVSNGETYWFENGFTMDDFKAILLDKIKNEGYTGNYLNKTKTIPAVTHQEDQGSYQVDYYYCSCGATRQP